MINKILKKYFFYLSFNLLFSLLTIQQNAKEILLYADDISYDQNKNIIARGKAKIIHKGIMINKD